MALQDVYKYRVAESTCFFQPTTLDLKTTILSSYMEKSRTFQIFINITSISKLYTYLGNPIKIFCENFRSIAIYIIYIHLIITTTTKKKYYYPFLKKKIKCQAFSHTNTDIGSTRGGLLGAYPQRTYS